jgi:tetratricopeptide (TPR) repeat protein
MIGRLRFGDLVNSRSGIWRRLAFGMLLAVGPMACAARAPVPPVVTTPRYPDFVFPNIPAEFSGQNVEKQHQSGWRFLQAGDLDNAERTFNIALKRTPSFYPAEAALGYVALADRDYTGAVAHFDRALSRSAAYVPALLGRGDALLGASRGAEAMASFEKALQVDPSLDEVRRRVDILKFRVVQGRVDEARKAAAAGDVAGARKAYAEALGASPDSALLYRELAALEFQQRDLSLAREHVQKAIALDPSDVRAPTLLGDIYDAESNFEAAIAAYEQAEAIEPSEALQARIEAVRSKARIASLPPQFQAIRQAPNISRSELAALIGVRLEKLVQAAGRGRAAVITDTRGHWASSWILRVTGARIMDVYPNHTFQPGAIVRRGELSEVVSRLLSIIGARDAALARQWTDARGHFTDIAPVHLGYPAASRAVASGVLPMLENNTFQLSRAVSGAEALAAIERLEALDRSAAAGAKGNP